MIASYAYNDIYAKDYYCEELYQKNNGEYFLFGYGRSESRYALHPNQKSKYGIGSDITPLSDSEAIEWMIEYSRGTYNRIYRHTSDCMLSRNRVMVDNSSTLIYYLRQNRGGTCETAPTI